MTKQQLTEFIARFGEYFNEDDLDSTMECFTEDAVYIEIDGTRNQGKGAIRATFEPQFSGKYGKQYFEEQDIIVDDEAQKACFRWESRITIGKTVVVVDGADVFTIEGGKIREKDSYVKASIPRLKKKIRNPLAQLKILLVLIRAGIRAKSLKKRL